MRTRKLTSALVWIALAGLLHGAPDGTIVLFNQSDTQLVTLREAAQITQQIFNRISIETTWSVCQVSRDPSQHCLLPAPGSYIQGVIVSKPTGPLQVREAMGSALTGQRDRGILFYVFSEPSKHLADTAERPVSVVLAYVIAHEIGHLMGLPHRRAGIMKSKLAPDDIRNAAMGNLYFTDSDGAALQAFTAAKANAASSAGR